MIDKIKLGKQEFDSKNYEKALGYFNGISEDDELYPVAQFYKFFCLMELKSYSDAIKPINYMIERNPYDGALWGEKARCHILLNEDEKALKALGEMERLVDLNDKDALLRVAQLYSILDRQEKVIEYADKVLAIDENNRMALYEKMSAASSLNDDNMVDEISDKILKISPDGFIGVMPVFMVKFLAGKYEDCYHMVETYGGSIKEDIAETLKVLIYEKLSEELNAQLTLSKVYDLKIDDAIKLMFDFKNNGTDHGVIHGIQYFIL